MNGFYCKKKKKIEVNLINLGDCLYIDYLFKISTIYLCSFYFITILSM